MGCGTSNALNDAMGATSGMSLVNGRPVSQADKDKFCKENKMFFMMQTPHKKHICRLMEIKEQIHMKAKTLFGGNF